MAALIEQGKRVIVLDNLENGHREAVHTDAVIEECDIRDNESVKRVFSRHKFDCVLHFGAYAYVGESMSKADEYFVNNVIGGHHLLNAMRNHNVNRIVFSSTCATYGSVTKVPITEDFPTDPINPYGRTKLAFEFLLRSYEESYGIRHAILRYFNAAGAIKELGEDHPTETHLIPLIMQVALGQRENISIFGTDYDTPDGTCIRDYIHVSDLASAHLNALDYIKEKSITCNLGTGSGSSVLEVIEAAREITGHPIPVIEAPKRSGDPARLTASAQYAKQELGWTAQYTDIKDIIRTAWEWHQNHPNGYKSR